LVLTHKKKKEKRKMKKKFEKGHAGGWGRKQKKLIAVAREGMGKELGEKKGSDKGE